LPAPLGPPNQTPGLEFELLFDPMFGQFALLCDDFAAAYADIDATFAW
jgi:hypothetical protein